MEMREGFMRPPRSRGGLMWPLVPLRARNMMGMDRMRLPPLRPGLMRGGPPVPPFVARGIAPPHARPRGMGPGMLPRPPVHPPGTMGPLGPRGMLPRAMLPPRPLGLDAGNPIECSQIPINGAMKEPLKNIKEINILKPVAGPGSNPIGNRMVNRNIKVHNRGKGNQNTGQSPLQNMHSAPHHSQPPPVQQNSGINPPHLLKHVLPIQSQINAGGVPQQAQPHPTQHQASLRGNRNGLNLRNRGAGGMGRGGLMNIPQMGGNVGNRGNAMMNRGAPINISPRGGPPVPPGRGNIIGGLPPPPVPYSSAPPVPPSSYPVPPPVVGSQGPIKRGGPPMGMPPPMPPKRVRYDAPLPANGYGQYQQQPPTQPTYASYDVPPPVDVYNNAPPPSLNVPQSQNYNSPDYNYPPGPQNNSYMVNAPYSSYNNDPSYSSYSGGSSAYDSSVEYHSPASSQSMNNSCPDPYGYKPAAPSDSYGAYSNVNYSNSQAGYDEYSSGYMDGSGYGAPVQDSSYNQSVGTYNNYSY